MVTSMRAQSRELIERDEAMINSAIGRTNTECGVVLRAAQNATGTAMTMDIIVPRVAIFRVSQIGRQRWCI